jgi:class 3 adenylate cyclase
VLVSAATMDSLSEADLVGFGFQYLGDHPLKGLPRPERIFQLLARR